MSKTSQAATSSGFWRRLVLNTKDTRLPIAFHFAMALAVGAVAALYLASKDSYVTVMQEDGFVEWLSFLLFLAAGSLGVVRAVRARRAFDLLVAMFCLFVAAEEISWGQRLIGYVPPDFFLQNNFQQETNLHNFSGFFGRPKWVLAAVLAGYGLLFPAASAGALRRMMQRIGATPPQPALIPWLAACVALLAWYPIEYTGEWVEMLAGALFLAAITGAQMIVPVSASVVMAAGLAWVSAARAPSSSQQLACAAAETEALARDVARGAGDREQLEGASIEKRIWSASEAGYLDWQRLANVHRAACAGEAGSRLSARRRYGIDPWGNAYWLQTGGEGEASGVTVYSFGPNRRRDLAGGDDVRATEQWDSPPSR